jgi:hypothetical protein
MRLRILLRSTTLLCVAAASAFAQVRRPTRPTLRTPSATTPPPPAPTLTTFTLSLDSISGGPGANQPNGKVTLSGPAPAGGFQVTLTSDNPAVTVPAIIAVPPGGTETTFQVTTTVVSAPTAVQITARSGSVSVTDSFKLLLRVVSVTPEPTPPGDGTRAAWRVTLSGPAPAGGITPSAHIHSGGYGGGAAPCHPIPVFTQPFIPAGSTSGVVEIRVDQSIYKQWPWIVVYGYYAAPILQFMARPAALASVDGPAAPLRGGTTGYATVRLNGTAPSQGCAQVDAATYDREYTFYFSSNSPVVQVPASTRVDPGQSTRPFAVTAGAVQSPQTATITVSKRAINGQLTAVKQVAITVTP